MFNGKTHILTVILYETYSKDKEDISIKKYRTQNIKFNNKCIRNVYDRKYYEGVLDIGKLEEALDLYGVDERGVGKYSYNINVKLF